MATLTIICSILSMLAVFLLLGKQIKFYSNRFQKIQKFIKKRGSLVGSIILILTFTLLYTIPTIQSQSIIGDAEISCTINTNRKIYHDIESDKYFILHDNDWDLFNIYSIEYIDNETAERIIEVAEILNKWRN